MKLKNLPKWQQEVYHITEFEHYLKQLNRRVEELKAIEDNIIFQGSIRMKCKYYNALDQILFFNGKIQSMLEEQLTVVMQD